MGYTHFTGMEAEAQGGEEPAPDHYAREWRHRLQQRVKGLGQSML